MKRWRWMVGLLLVMVFLGSVAGGWLYWQTRAASSRFAPQLIRVREPMPADALAQRLAQRKILRRPDLLAWWLRIRGKPIITPGDYEFSPNQSLFEIADILIHERFTQNWVTIPEGWTMRRSAERLQERGIADASTFLALCQQPKWAEQVGLPPPPIPSLEGYLFPSTYRLPPGSGAENALHTMLRATYQSVYLPYKEVMDKRGLTFHEILTIASLIEKEAFKDDERPTVASVIFNRLERNMRLQIDATVLYGMGIWKDRVLYKDLEHPSPYNTYRISGLPPGPICSPGLASIRAVLNPTKTDYLFYVARGDGYHHFSRTYEEHLQAIREIRGR